MAPILVETIRKKIDVTQTAPAILLLVNSLSWYILISVIFRALINHTEMLEIEKTEILATYFVSIALSALAGSKFFLDRGRKQLYLWPFLGTIATFALTSVLNSGVLVNFLLAVFLGFSIGAGLPSCLGKFANLTRTDNRGLIAGISWGCVGTVVLAIAFLTTSMNELDTLIVLTIWRLFGSVGFWLLSRNKTEQIMKKSPKYKEIINRREILIYLFPWIIFMFINFAEMPVLESTFNSVFGENFFSFLQLAEFAFIGVFALIGGILADIVGRKKVVIAGFIILGVEYAVITLFSITTVTSYLFLALDGTTWGLLFSVFLTVLWGDLAEDRAKEKYYVLGGLPYILTNILYLLIRPVASAIVTGTAFSVASFFLFLAVIPLMYAPETLPEKVMKDRDLKSYVEKAKKKVEKETEKTQKKTVTSKPTQTEEKIDGESEENNDEYEKARQLAEKYY